MPHQGHQGAATTRTPGRSAVLQSLLKLGPPADSWGRAEAAGPRRGAEGTRGGVCQEGRRRPGPRPQGASPPYPWPFLRLQSHREGRPGRGPQDEAPSPPHRPTPPPHPARRLLATTIQALAPPTDYRASSPQPPAAWLLALRPQGHVYTKTEGTRSKRECSRFRMFPGPTHAGQRR